MLGDLINARAVRHGFGAAFGTFGELLQGALSENDREFLVTLPISAWSRAQLQLNWGRAVTIEPKHKTKSLRLVRSMLRRHGWSGGAQLIIASNIPEGKGLASSSADLVATARAVAEALGIDQCASDIEDLLREIEPSDGVMHPGVVAFYHREVRLHSHLASLPPLTIVAIDEGGQVDTIAYNTLPKRFTAADKREYTHLLHRLSRALRESDVRAIGSLATRSSEMNQGLHPKRTLHAMRSLCADIDGLGVAVAHSGTMVGLLLSDRDPMLSAKVSGAIAECERLAGRATVFQSLPLDGATADAVRGVRHC